MNKRPRIGFLASNTGSSFRAIVEAIREGELEAEPALLVSNRRSASALAFAGQCGIVSQVIATEADPVLADQQLCQAMQAARVDLIVLSGYLRRLGPVTLAAWPDAILNIHPGPLPDFGGEGMYGRAVHAAVISASLRQTEITIHLVDGDYDHGEVLVRHPVPIPVGCDAAGLEALVTAAEPSVFVQALKARLGDI